MEKVTVSIQGLYPGLLMNNPAVMGLPVRETYEEAAADRAYWSADHSTLVIPAQWLYRGLILAGSMLKKVELKGKKYFIGPIIAGDVQVLPADIPLGIDKYDIHLARVKNLGTRGSVIRARPWIKEWAIEFEISWETSLLGENFYETYLPNLLTTQGEAIGIGDFRPRMKGPYGKYKVVSIR